MITALVVSVIAIVGFTFLLTGLLTAIAEIDNIKKRINKLEALKSIEASKRSLTMHGDK